MKYNSALIILSFVFLISSCSKEVFPDLSFSYLPRIAFLELRNTINIKNDNYLISSNNGSIIIEADNTHILIPDKLGPGTITLKDKKEKIVKTIPFLVKSPPKPKLQLTTTTPNHLTHEKKYFHLLPEISLELTDGDNLVFNYPVQVDGFDILFIKDDTVIYTINNTKTNLNNTFFESDVVRGFDRIDFRNIKVVYEGGYEYMVDNFSVSSDFFNNIPQD